MDKKDFEEIIKLAIQNEIEAHRFYRNVSEKMTDSYLVSMFRDLAEEEKKHKRILERILEGGKVQRYFLEAPDYGVSSTVDKPSPSLDMKPADAIALAMKNEEEAMMQYQELARACIDSEKKAIFNDLAAMESGHKMKMENAFVDIGYPEVW